MAGLQPQLAWQSPIRLIGLWLGGAAHLWCMSNHGTQDKPAINTHTQGGATGMAAYTTSSANTICLKLPINIVSNIYPCPVSEGPKESHLGGVW